MNRERARVPGGQPVAVAEPRAEPDGVGIGPFHSFRYRDYRWLWLGNSFSSAAMWVQQTTMGWVTYDLTGSGALLGAVNVVRNVPTLVAAPVAGVAADRLSSNTIVAVSQLLLFVNALALALALWFDVLHIWHLFAFALIAGALNTFNQPARQTMVFDVVPRAAVPNAIALNSIAQNVTRTAGPMLGGALIVYFGPGDNFLVQALVYLAVMGTVLVMRRISPRLEPSGRRSFWKEMVEGYRWAMSNPQARLLLLMMMLYPSFIIPIHLGLMPIFAKEVFHTDAGGLGLLLSALGVGGLIGGFLAASLNQVDRRGLLQLIALYTVSLFVAAFAVVGALTGNLWLGVVLLVISGIGGSLFNTTNQLVVQLVAPDQMRGRITGLLNIQPLFQSAGILATGWAADIIGPSAVATADGLIMCAIGAAILIFSPRMRELRLSRLTQQAAGAGVQ
jgi:MFS family permease